MKKLLTFSLGLLVILIISACKKDAIVEVTLLDAVGNRIPNTTVYSYINSVNQSQGPGSSLSKKSTDSNGKAIFSGLTEGKIYFSATYESIGGQKIQCYGSTEAIAGYTTEAIVKP